MSKELTIQNQGNAFSVSIPIEAQEQKTKTLALAEKIIAVSNLDDQQTAIEVVSWLNGLTKGMEKTREEVKKPFLEAGRLIDATAKTYAKEIESAATRVQCLIVNFQDREKARIKQQAIDQENARRAAEEALAKAQQQATEAKTASERMEAELEAMELQEEASAPIVAREVPKAEGASVGEKWDYDTINVHELYRAFPHLCKIEPNRSAILYELKTLVLQGKPVKLPGLRTFQETKISVRAKSL